jgi:hypothetical protein
MKKNTAVKIACVMVLALALALIQPLGFALSAALSFGAGEAASPGGETGAVYAEEGQETGDPAEGPDDGTGGEDPDDGTEEKVPEEETPVTVDTSALVKAIEDAKNAKKDVASSTNGADVGVDKLWAPQTAFNTLNASIDEAEKVLKGIASEYDDTEKAAAAREAVNANAAALRAAIKAFEDARSYGTKPGGGEATNEVVNALYLKNDEPGKDGKKHFVGEDYDLKYKDLSVTTKGKTIQLNGYFTTNRSDGAMYETADQNSPVGEVLLKWESSDDAIATVSPNGLITAISDGEATIRATITEENKYEGTAPSKSVLVRISGQTAEYVKNVTIIDENGASLSSRGDATTVIEGKNKFFSFYALITWHDPATGDERTEDTRTDTVTSTIKWSVGGSSVIATINEDTGRLKTTEYSGNCFVQCSVTGGVSGQTVKDTARVMVDTGEYAYQPANSLTLKVVYQEFPDKVAQTHTYSLSELSGRLSSVTNSYTVLGGNRYGVIRASGYLFKDVLALEGVKIEDVHQFRFSTADGYDNPITSQFLYGSGSRYYFPNWDIGSRAGAKVVPPILAYESNMMWGESMADPSVPLDEGTRFRLVFGPLWGGESNSSYQIYYIQGITIVLKGAPPAENEKPKDEDKKEDPKKEDDKKKDEDKTIGPGDKGESGGNGGDGKNPAGTPGSGGQNAGGSNVSGGPNSGGDGSEGGGESAASGESARADAGRPGSDPGPDKSAEAGTGAKTAGKGVIPFSSNGKFKVYEMISNTGTNVAPIDMDLPYLGAAGPLAGGCVAAGGLSFFIGFKRRLL